MNEEELKNGILSWLEKFNGRIEDNEEFIKEILLYTSLYGYDVESYKKARLKKEEHKGKDNLDELIKSRKLVMTLLDHLENPLLKDETGYKYIDTVRMIDSKNSLSDIHNMLSNRIIELLNKGELGLHDAYQTESKSKLRNDYFRELALVYIRKTGRKDLKRIKGTDSKSPFRELVKLCLDWLGLEVPSKTLDGYLRTINKEQDEWEQAEKKWDEELKEHLRLFTDTTP